MDSPWDYASTIPMPACISNRQDKPFRICSLALRENAFPCSEIVTALEWLIANAKGTNHSSENCAETSLTIVSGELKEIPGDVQQELQAEAYSLTISPSTVILRAQTAHGAFNGLMTLRRALQSGRPLIEADILDWPMLKVRGFHLTLGSGHMPAFSRLLEIIEQLAEWKYNQLILEYDDRFPWNKHPDIVHPQTYSMEQLLSLIRFAEQHFVEVVPLLDSLGHAEQYLKHQRYHSLREHPESIHEMCPSNPETMRFIKELWTEVLSVHQNSRYAHISGDEVFRLTEGFCPHCANYAKNGNLAQLYTKYYGELSSWIITQNKTPIIWGDTLLKCPEDIANFPRSVVINDWAYMPIDSNTWNFRHFEKDHNGNSTPLRKQLFERYWGAGDSIENPSFPTTRFFCDQGFKVIAATAASNDNGKPSASLIPGLRNRYINNKRFAQAICNCQGDGMIVTFWSDFFSVESAWFGIAAGADFSWRPREETFERFAERFDNSFLMSNSNAAEQLVLSDRFLCTPYAEQRPANAKPITSMRKDSIRTLPNVYSQLFDLSREACAIEARLHQLHRTLLSKRFGGAAQQLSLLPFANATRSECIDPKTPEFIMPEGVIRALDFAFDITLPETGHKYIALHTPERSHVSIRINARFAAFGLLTGAFWVADGDTIGKIRLHYTDNTNAEIPLIGGINVCDWWGRPRLATNAVVAWTGETKERCCINFYLSMISNPYPCLTIRELSIDIEDSRARILLPSLVGITAIEGKDHADVSDELKALSESICGIEPRIKDIYSMIMPADEATKQADNATTSLKAGVESLKALAT